VVAVTNHPSDNTRFLLTVLFAAWVLALVYSIVTYMTTAGDSGGLGRVSTFLGWQGVAGVMALAIFAKGRSWPAKSSIRSLSRVPLGLAVIMAAVVIWAGLSR